jgi:hypothetical protein
MSPRTDYSDLKSKYTKTDHPNPSLSRRGYNNPPPILGGVRGGKKDRW